MKKRMTLAQLKRDANSGCLVLEMVERYGDTGEQIPQRLRGKRPVTRSNSVGIFLRNVSGEESEMRLDNAKLTEYTGDELVIYSAGYRDLTEQEKEILDTANQIRAEHDGVYWYARGFVNQSACPWMLGDLVRGKKYDRCKEKVLDYSVRGSVILRYKVYREGQQNGKAV